MILELIQEKPPDKGFAIAAVIVSGFAVVFLLAFIAGILSLPTIHEGSTPEIIGYIITIILSGVSMVIGILLSIVGVILQLILAFSWKNAISTNIQNTEIVVKYIQKYLSEEKKALTDSILRKLSYIRLPIWPLWTYTILLVIAPSVGKNLLGIAGGILLFVGALAFLGIFLHFVFEATSTLSTTKKRLYEEILSEDWPSYPSIGQKSAVLVVIISILTASIYWLYILLRITEELSEFINKEQIVRFTLINRLKKQESS